MAGAAQHGEGSGGRGDVTDSTIGISANGTIDVGDLGDTGSIGYDATPSGQSGIVATYGAAVTTPDVGVSAGLGPVVSNGRTLNDQSGIFHYASFSGGDGPYAGSGTVAWGYNAKGRLIVDGSLNWEPGRRGRPRHSAGR
jgi:hypothetical protein